MPQSSTRLGVVGASMATQFVEKLERRNLADVLFASVVGLGYFLHSLRFHGPAYISDEVAYVAKAIVISGHSFETRPGGWHGGYSFLIAPAFALADSPQRAWLGVLAINALIWALSFFVLSKTLKRFFPDVGRVKFYSCLVVCAFYPTWVSMSGYSFSTPALALFSMLCFGLLLKSDLQPNRYLVLFSLCAGYLYWIHTIGIVFGLLAVLLFVHRMVVTRTLWAYSLLILTVVGMVWSYQAVVHPALNNALAPAGTDALGHYAAADLLGSASTPTGAFEWVVAIAGHVGYSLIATFGIVGYGLLVGLSRLWRQVRTSPFTCGESADPDEKEQTTQAWALGFCTAAFLGVIALSSLYLSSEGQASQADHVMYGRHSDSIMLPLLGVGILTAWTLRRAAIMAGGIMLVAIGFAGFEARYSDLTSVNLVNVAGFWPRLVDQDVELMTWFTLGAIGVIGAGAVVKLGKKPALLLLIPIFALTVRQQSNWHNGILASYSSESGIQAFVEDNHTEDECIGYEVGASKDFPGNLGAIERPRLQSYYLYRYDVKQLTIDEWFGSCDGPYITPYNNHDIDDGKVAYVAREDSSGLFVVVKADQVFELGYDQLEDPQNLYYPADYTCVSFGCYQIGADDLSRYTIAGTLNDGQLVTTENKGELFFGPYTRLKAGSYLLKLDMEVEEAGSGVTVAVNGNELDEFGLDEITPYVEYGFDVSQDVTDFEVTVTVSDDSVVFVDGYEVVLRNPKAVPPN